MTGSPSGARSSEQAAVRVASAARASFQSDIELLLVATARAGGERARRDGMGEIAVVEGVLHAHEDGQMVGEETTRQAGVDQGQLLGADLAGRAAVVGEGGVVRAAVGERDTGVD